MGEEGDRGNESQACERGGPAMDTPDRNRIATPVSQFEDSPVFNYINNLSPIETVKSMRISQTFNSFSFASLPSIFTSPHVNSLKESRFLRRHQFSDPSKPEFSSKHGEKVDGNEAVMDVVHNSDEQQGNVDQGSCIGEASVEPTHECSKVVVDGLQNPSYDWCTTTCSGVETQCASEFASKTGSVVPLVNEVSETGSIGSGMHLEGIKNIEQNKEGAGCDWESLISDAAELLVFDSPNDTEAFKCPPQKSLDPGTSLCSSPVAEFREDENNDLRNTEAVGPVGVEQWESENPSTQVREGHLKEPQATRDIFASTSLNKHMMGEPSEQIDNEPVSNLHRGMRRRCLVFDMSGARRKHLDDTSGSGSSMTLQSDANVKSNDQQLVPMKAVNDSSRCILPRIGLHLNSLARTSEDYDIVSHGTLISGRQLINDPTSTSSLHSLTSGQEPLNNSLAATSMERNIDVAENGVQDLEDASQASGYIANEEINQISPRKKRRRLENATESEGCKRCNCKKSKCLKLYCDCFAAGVYCVETCSCQGCFNKPIHEDTVLATRKQIESRNPLAFAPKVVRSSDSGPETGDESSKTPASARHKRGCNCKKSGCLKKYCECYQIGVGCSINCRCEGCKNAFGKKDGSALIGTESELEEEEAETCERSVLDKSSQKNVIRNSVEPNPDGMLPATPLQPGGASVHTMRKPPRSSFLSIGSSSGFYGSQKFGKRNFLQPPPKFEKQLEAVQEDDMPGILQENCSPISGVKSASPNSKRVSPPHSDLHSDFGSSSGRKSSRKLILQSIPSFPSLTPKH